MLTIPNVQTADDYTAALELGPVATTVGIKYVVANAAVWAQVVGKQRSGTLETWGDELLITPETNSIIDVTGIRFRSAVPGTPARVVAQLYLPHDPKFGSGTPFSGTLSGSGAVSPTGALGADGWVSIGTILSYTSTDGHTFVAATNADLSGTIPLGARVKLTQLGAVAYYIVTAITGASITLYGGTDYTLTNNPITAVNYSTSKVPFGFNSSPLKWTEELRDTATRTQLSPVNGTWYNLGALQLAVPIGAWRLYWVAYTQSNGPAGQASQRVSVSTNASAESDGDLTAQWSVSTATGVVRLALMREKFILLGAKTPYYLISESDDAPTSINLLGAPATVIRAVCAYL